MKLLKKYLLALFFQHRTVFVWPLNQLILRKNVRVSIAAVNLIFFLKRSKFRVTFENESGLYCVADGYSKHYFGDLIRGLGLYLNGLENRAKRLFDSYLLGGIDFSHDDLVIDCGANYADLWLSFKDLINESNYITFEPGLREHLSISKNAQNGIHIMKGLSNKEEVVTYYVNERNADSSIVEPLHYTHTLEVETTTLDNYVNENKIEKIKLFKLEAEGFEPEILDGALNVLDRIEYIALDGGYERGKSQAETFSGLCNKLHDHGFIMIGINFIWARALFINQKSAHNFR